MGPHVQVCFCGVEALELSDTGSPFCNCVCREANRNFRIYFICIKIAKFAFNLIPGCNSPVAQGSGLFYFLLFVCVFGPLLSFPSSFPSSLTSFFLFFFLVQHVTTLQRTTAREMLSSSACPGEPPHLSTWLWWQEADRCSFLRSQQRIICSNFILFCFVLTSFIF